MIFKERLILLGMSGGVSCYKSLELIRRLKERGAQVRVLMTPSAQKFVTPLQVGALADGVHTDLLSSSDYQHIALSQNAAAMVVAPATANTLARLAGGFADEVLSATYLTYQGRKLVCPAMNHRMWQSPATQRNVLLVRQHGTTVMEPEEGSLACGEEGPGRLPTVEHILHEVNRLIHFDKRYAGKRVVVSAGGTMAPIDPVRHITNASSGRMGHAVAVALWAMGCDVKVIKGLTDPRLDWPQGMEIHHCPTVGHMKTALMDLTQDAHLLVQTAAISDFRIKAPNTKKVKRGKEAFTLELEPETDLLAMLAEDGPKKLIRVGFAAETHGHRTYANKKLKDKKLAAICCNPVGDQRGFGDVPTRLTVFFDQGMPAEVLVGPDDKATVGRELAHLLAARFLQHL